MTKTKNYALTQWDPGDPIRRADFNRDNAVLDAALGELGAERVVVGSYTGDGVSGRVIELPFTPKVVMVSGYYGNTNVQYGYLTIAFGAYGHWVLGDSTGPGGNIQIVENGFSIQGTNHNLANKEEHYLALR
jgi:hypothetical protein